MCFNVIIFRWTWVCFFRSIKVIKAVFLVDYLLCLVTNIYSILFIFLDNVPYSKSRCIFSHVRICSSAVRCPCKQWARNGMALLLVARTGCQDVRERKRGGGWGAVSQVVPPVGWLPGREGCSVHTVSLNWCFQSRNVSSFGTCFVFLCFQRTFSNPQQVIFLFLLMECKNMSTRVQDRLSERQIKPFPLTVALRCNARHLCLSFGDEWDKACPYICFLHATRPPPGYGLCQPSRKADLLADAVDCTLLPVKAKGTVCSVHNKMPTMFMLP